MTSQSAVDINSLPAPELVELLDFEAIYTELVQQLDGAAPLLLDEQGQPRAPALLQAELVTGDGEDYFKVPAGALSGLSYVQLDSEPLAKLLQVAAYREMLVRQRINDAARGVMVAYAVGSDLDQLAANNNTARLDGEEDPRFRARVPLAFEGLATAGPEGAYKRHALGADARVKDALATSPSEGVVEVVILSTEGNGSPQQDLLDTVAAALDAKTVRPLTDNVQVLAPTIRQYTIEATLYPIPGPVDDELFARAETAALAYAEKQHALGAPVTRSGLFRVLQQEGIERVQLHAPEFDILNQPDQAAWLSGIELVRG